MGSVSSKEQQIATALENHDISELRTILKDCTPEQIRALCKAYVPADETQCTILHYATWQDNPELLAPLLDYADDLEVRDDLGWTPLMTAVNRGSKQNVNMLLARGAKIDCDYCGGMSLIADAMNFNDTELLMVLMDHGARVTPSAEMLGDDQEKNAYFLLHYAVDDGLVDVTKVLIEKGKIPLNTLDQAGWSALHLAAGHNNLDLVILLTAKGADVNIKDSQGNTPLAWAREMNANNVISELEKRGGIADKEWLGEKIELKTKEGAEEWAEGEYDEDVEAQQGQGANNGVENGRFEIEIEDTKSKKQVASNNKNSTVLDPIQLHRSTAKAVY